MVMKGLPTGLITSTDFPEGLQSCWRGSFVKKRKQLGERGGGVIRSYCFPQLLCTAHSTVWNLGAPSPTCCGFCLSPSPPPNQAGDQRSPCSLTPKHMANAYTDLGHPKKPAGGNQLLADFKNNNITWDKYKPMSSGDTHTSLPGFLHPHVFSY